MRGIRIPIRTPSKVRIILEKKSKDKTEIYLDKPKTHQKIRYYKRITLVKEKSGTRIEIDFSKIKFNKKVDPNKITKINLPKNCKIIDVN